MQLICNRLHTESDASKTSKTFMNSDTISRQHIAKCRDPTRQDCSTTVWPTLSHGRLRVAHLLASHAYTATPPPRRPAPSRRNNWKPSMLTRLSACFVLRCVSEMTGMSMWYPSSSADSCSMACGFTSDAALKTYSVGGWK